MLAMLRDNASREDEERSSGPLPVASFPSGGMLADEPKLLEEGGGCYSRQL